MAHLIAKYTEANGNSAARVDSGVTGLDHISPWQRDQATRRMMSLPAYTGQSHAPANLLNGHSTYDLPTPRKVPTIGISSNRESNLPHSVQNGNSNGGEKNGYNRELFRQMRSDERVRDTMLKSSSIPNGLSISSNSKETLLMNSYAKDALNRAKMYGSSRETNAIASLKELLDRRDLEIYATLPRGKARETLAQALLDRERDAPAMAAYSLDSHRPSQSKAARTTISESRSCRDSYMPQSNTTRETFGTDSYYLTKMADILDRYTSNAMFTSSPSRVTEYMYVGGYNDAENWPYLKRLGITHVLNMAGPRKSSVNPYPPESGIVGYDMIDADDAEYYDVMQHFPRAKVIIDKAKYGRGKVLVHCAMGINRSGTMCCAYLMQDEGLSLLDAVRRMKSARGTTLTNRAFQRQLLRFARLKGYL